MRKTIVYHYRSKHDELNKQLRATPPNTYAYTMLKFNIARNFVKICLFDPSGGLSALYELDRFNESIN